MSDLYEAHQPIHDDLTGRFLTFYIGDAIYGIGLSRVIEIISVQEITRIPNLPSYIKGIINLRGKIVPVMDIRLRFGLSEKSYDDLTCIIVVNMDDMNIGLIADQVHEVTAAEDTVLTELPEFNDKSACTYLESIGKLGSDLVLNIDCRRLFYDDRPSPDSESCL
jgi:purine-binding chemotaxis protein CheW